MVDGIDDDANDYVDIDVVDNKVNDDVDAVNEDIHIDDDILEIVVDDEDVAQGGFPLNISPLPTVQNSSKAIHSQNIFTHTILTKVFYLKDLP